MIPSVDAPQTLVCADGAQLAYWQHRAPQSRGVLLFIHGVASNHTRFSEFIKHSELTGSWDTLCVDLRGHAASVHRGVINLDVWGADLCALLDACGYSRAVLVGHSLGANIAARFAHRYSERVAGLILIDPVQAQAMLKPRARSALGAVLSVAAPVARWLNAVGLHRRELPMLDLEQLDQHARVLLAQGRDAEMEQLYSSSWESLKYFPTATYLQDVAQALQQLSTPAALVPALMLLSVHGRDAAVELNRAYAARLPQCDVVEIPCNHWILTAAPDAARVAIETWVTRLGASIHQ